jgi:hypothetical protein
MIEAESELITSLEDLETRKDLTQVELGIHVQERNRLSDKFSTGRALIYGAMYTVLATGMYLYTHGSLLDAGLTYTGLALVDGITKIPNHFRRLSMALTINSEIEGIGKFNHAIEHKRAELGSLQAGNLSVLNQSLTEQLGILNKQNQENVQITKEQMGAQNKLAAIEASFDQAIDFVGSGFGIGDYYPDNTADISRAVNEWKDAMRKAGITEEIDIIKHLYERYSQMEVKAAVRLKPAVTGMKLDLKNQITALEKTKQKKTEIPHKINKKKRN